MGNGLPTKSSQVEPSSSDSEVVYRAIACGGSNSTEILRSAASVVTMKDYAMTHDNTTKAMQELHAKTESESNKPPVVIRYVDTERPVSMSHVTLNHADDGVLSLVDDFMITNGISCEKRHPLSNLYRCHSIVDCAVIRFDVRLVPATYVKGITIEFKRTFGCAESFGKLFRQFKSCTLSYIVVDTPASENDLNFSARMSLNCDDFHRRSQARALPYEEPHEVEINSQDLQQAISAMALWIGDDPMEALQCVGQFYLAMNVHVLRSTEILMAVCGVVENLQEYTDETSVLIMSLCMHVIRQFMKTPPGLSLEGNILTTQHMTMISQGVARAAMGTDLTARREAVNLLIDLNPRFTKDIKQRLSVVPGLALNSVTLPMVA